jgi:hypothetical protein
MQIVQILGTVILFTVLAGLIIIPLFDWLFKGIGDTKDEE